MSDKKPVGRPPKGNDARITLRLSYEQNSAICKYGREYRITDNGGFVNRSEAIRSIIDKFHEIMVLSDNIDLATHKICVAAKLLEQIAEALDDTQAADTLLDTQQNLLAVAHFFHNEFSYEDGRPDIRKKAFLFERSTGKIIVTEQKRTYCK